MYDLIGDIMYSDECEYCILCNKPHIYFKVWQWKDHCDDCLFNQLQAPYKLAMLRVRQLYHEWGMI